LAVGWIAVLVMPRLFVRLGVAGGLLIVTGGLVYPAGAAMYAWVVMTRCPPSSATTKWHEQVLRQPLMALTLSRRCRTPESRRGDCAGVLMGGCGWLLTP
jgi:channel protein (hemolysin III family)